MAENNPKTPPTPRGAIVPPPGSDEDENLIKIEEKE